MRRVHRAASAALYAVLALSAPLYAASSSENETQCTAEETCSAGVTPKVGKATLKDVTCVDLHDDCALRAEAGDCGKYAGFMLDECPKSCLVCGKFEEPQVVDDEPCVDRNTMCQYWAQRNECETNPKYTIPNCRKSCKACETSITSTIAFGVEQQEGKDLDIAPKVSAIIRESKKYMRKVKADPELGSVRESCRNGNEMCSIWAAQGECEKNPAFMRITCAPACHSCDMVDVQKRCPVVADAPNALEKKGDLNKLFERIIDIEDFSKYNPVVIQRPYTSGETRKRTWNLGPWMVSFENFLTDQEADRLVEIANERGFGQSEEVTRKPKPDGTYEFVVSSRRTSYNTWCDETCEDDPIVRGVVERISNITGIPEVNSEPLQLLRYENGQEYSEHADYIKYQKVRPCGPRILTLLLYLSDDFEGGGTKFRFLRGYTVTPKKGKAVLWANVLNSDPNEEDELFDHEALPVTGGVKYAANAWLHMRDFKNNAKTVCV